MKSLVEISFGCFLLVCISCSSSTQKQTEEHAKADSLNTATVAKLPHHFKGFKTGMPINYIPCNQDSTETYCLYLPKDYDTSKAWPVIYFFDAHARGKLPVKKYHELAEKYQAIFVGSNNSQNGLKGELYDKIVNDLMGTTREILNIDDKKIMACGFSGGAKVAASAAMKSNDISAVIGCAAPMDISQIGSSYFNFVGIVGKGDFNYWDMVELNLSLNKTGLKHHLLTFDGIHEWPDLNTIDQAMAIATEAKEASAIKDAEIATNLREKEFNAKNSYIKAFQSQGPAYWMSAISALQTGYKNGAGDEKWMNRRLLSFINMMAYLKTAELLNGNHLEESEGFLKAFKASDPKNPDGPFLTADYYALKGDKPKAIASLNEALKMGYDDYAHFSTDPMLASLKGESGYAAVKAKLLGD